MISLLIKYAFNTCLVLIQLATVGYGVYLGFTESWMIGGFIIITAFMLSAAAFDVPAPTGPPDD